MRVIPLLARVTLFALVVYTVLALAMESTLDQALQIGLGPVSVYGWDLLLLAVLILLLRELFASGGLGLPRRNRMVVFLVFGYCAYQIAVVFSVSVVFHDLEPIGVIRELGWRVGVLLIPFVYLVGLRYVQARTLIVWLSVAGVLLAVYAMYLYSTDSVPAHANDVGVIRLRGAWGGASLLFGLLILSCLFLFRASLLGYAGAIIGLIGLVLTNHRSGYLALLVVGIPPLIHFRRASLRVVVVSLVVVTAGVLLMVASPSIRSSTYYSLTTMISPNADINTTDRIERSRLGWDYFVAHPIGDYAWSHELYLVDLGPDSSFEPHNFVIQLLGQQGIVGFAFFAAIIFATARIGWRNRNVDRMSAVMLAYFAFYLIFSLFNTEFINQWNILLLAAPVGVLLSRNAAIERAADQQLAGPEALVADGELVAV